MKSCRIRRIRRAQFIEIYNHSTNSVDVSGCILTMIEHEQICHSGGTVIGRRFCIVHASAIRLHAQRRGRDSVLIKAGQQPDPRRGAIRAQANGVSYGRWPDGANDFYAFTTTRQHEQRAIWIGDIVINELMYDPSAATTTINTLNFTTRNHAINLPAGSSRRASLSVPATRLSVQRLCGGGQEHRQFVCHYTNLNSGNTYGNYSGKLSHNGELVVLSQPESYFGTNTIYVEEDEVTYGVGGRWGEWSPVAAAAWN